MESDSDSFFPYLPEILGGKTSISDSSDLPFEIFSYKELECIKNEKISLEATVLKLMQDLQEKSKQLDRVTYYLDSIVKNINEGLIFVNHTGIITTFNSAAEKILGLRQKDILFTAFGEKFSDTAFGFSLSKALKKLDCPGISYSKYVFKGKIEKELEISISPVYRRGRVQQGIILVVRDITRQRQLMKIEQQNRRMQELGQIAATVAHEIRNPLGGIEGFASLLQKDLQNEYPEWSKMAGYIIEGSKTIGRLVENVLRSARPLSPQPTEFNIVELVQEIQKHIEIDPNFPKEIRLRYQPYEPRLNIFADRAMLGSVMLHLIRNACQAIEGSGLIQITTFQKEHHLILTIKDTGPGIAPENLDRIFSPFFTTKEKGNGLGLYETYRIIQTHNGQIETKSSADYGTLFIITLPIKGFTI